jgi:hypothetical protein
VRKADTSQEPPFKEDGEFDAASQIVDTYRDILHGSQRLDRSVPQVGLTATPAPRSGACFDVHRRRALFSPSPASHTSLRPSPPKPPPSSSTMAYVFKVSALMDAFEKDG